MLHGDTSWRPCTVLALAAYNGGRAGRHGLAGATRSRSQAQVEVGRRAGIPHVIHPEHHIERVEQPDPLQSGQQMPARGVRGDREGQTGRLQPGDEFNRAGPGRSPGRDLGQRKRVHLVAEPLARVGAGQQPLQDRRGRSRRGADECLLVGQIERPAVRPEELLLRQRPARLGVQQQAVVVEHDPARLDQLACHAGTVRERRGRPQLVQTPGGMDAVNAVNVPPATARRAS